VIVYELCTVLQRIKMYIVNRDKVYVLKSLKLIICMPIVVLKTRILGPAYIGLLLRLCSTHSTRPTNVPTSIRLAFGTALCFVCLVKTI